MSTTSPHQMGDTRNTSTNFTQLHALQHPAQRARVLLYHGRGANLFGFIDTFVDNMRIHANVQLMAMDHVPPNVCDMFDAVVVPGGSANEMSHSLGSEGLACLQSFVRNGGGYLGICGGAHLGSSSSCSGGGAADGAVTYQRLSLLPTAVWPHALWGYGEHLRGRVLVKPPPAPSSSSSKQPHQDRWWWQLMGTTILLLALTAMLPRLSPRQCWQHLTCLIGSGLILSFAVLKIHNATRRLASASPPSPRQYCYYHNGPMWDAATLPPHIETFFPILQGVGDRAQRQDMQGKALGVRGHYGKGAVVLCGCHPEKTTEPEMQQVLAHILRSVLPTTSSSKSSNIQCCCANCQPDPVRQEKQLQRMKSFREHMEDIEQAWMEELDLAGEAPPSPRSFAQLRRTWMQEATRRSATTC